MVIKMVGVLSTILTLVKRTKKICGSDGPALAPLGMYELHTLFWTPDNRSNITWGMWSIEQKKYFCFYQTIDIRGQKAWTAAILTPPLPLFRRSQVKLDRCDHESQPYTIWEPFIQLNPMVVLIAFVAYNKILKKIVAPKLYVKVYGKKLKKFFPWETL